MIFADYKLHHVGIVTPTFEEAEAAMASLGLKEDYRGYVDIWSCWCIFTTSREGAAIELVVPEGGPLLRFNKGGGGVHHFAFEVDSLADAMESLAKQGMRMIEPEPVKGAGDFWCNFLSPASTRGIQIELVEPFR